MSVECVEYVVDGEQVLLTELVETGEVGAPVVVIGTRELIRLLAVAVGHAIAEPVVMPCSRVDIIGYVVIVGGVESHVKTVDREIALHIFSSRFSTGVSIQ